jgi:acetyltransferase-like isoleucine patch superfamily enzyme
VSALRRLAKTVALARSELLARVRGEQTIRRMRGQGLQAPDPFYVAARVSIDPGFAWAVEIGADATLSANVQIIAHDAAMFRMTGYTLVRPVRIGVRSYVGAGVTILPGAVIGDDAVIGAGSVVTGEIPAGAVAVGNPARVIGDARELVERHRRAMTEIPRFERGPAEPGGLSADEVAAMTRALATHGRLYVR